MGVQNSSISPTPNFPCAFIIVPWLYLYNHTLVPCLIPEDHWSIPSCKILRPGHEFRPYPIVLQYHLKMCLDKTEYTAARAVWREQSSVQRLLILAAAFLLMHARIRWLFWKPFSSPLWFPVHSLMSTAHMSEYYLNKRSCRCMWCKELLKWFISHFHHVKNNIESKATQLGEA